GVKLDDINVGNMGSKSNRTKYATTLWLTDEERNDFNKLLLLGKRVHLQVLPTDSAIELSQLLRK
ncbi:TPA: PTS transporter subunit IIB, partial [Klebsiella pneumoniae]|nr:PTS transporter subunit IIB [Klebsiella pneumoniae]